MSELDPNDPMLIQPAPHERAGILRAQRAGWPVEDLAKLFHTGSRKLLKEIGRAVNQEAVAYRLGLPMHEARIPKENK
jgi:hypothetical protein